MTEVDRIVRLLEKTFDQQPWYGSSIMEILKTIKPEIAQQRVSDAHCISELISHMIAWRTFATHRLQGDTQFDVDDDINFIKDLGWQETIDQLKKSQEELLKAMKQFSPERLSELVPSSRFRYTYYTLLHGVIQHDIYHLGQIAILKKVIPAYRP